MIDYLVDVAETHSHRYHVTLTVDEPSDHHTFSLPVWIPGSYMVREFGRHLSGLQATRGGRACQVTQLDKTTWAVVSSGRGALRLSYGVYAFDTSVRAAFLDAERGFFNGTSLFLRVEGREADPHGMRLAHLPKGWDVATAMPPVPQRRHTFQARDYDELVDHPVELGRFWRGSFEAGGVAHEFVVSGAWPSLDGERLLKDSQRICEAQIAFWHGQGQGQEPTAFERYVFMLNVVDNGYGGLEHRASTALIAARQDLPRVGGGHSAEGYTTLLGLISHEYFHTWNVKRLRPQDLHPLDYTRENYTELLWFFEGFTSYYDDLFLLRTGLVDAKAYLRLLAKAAQGVQGMPGRQVQSVAQASFDAWVKYYRSDENTPNTTVSYYTKGALVALCVDLSLRLQRRGTLDDLMRTLWRRCGDAREGGAITEADIHAVLLSLKAPEISAQLRQWVHGTDELPVAELLAAFGVGLEHDAPTVAARYGLRVSEGPLSGVQIKSVLRGSLAEAAGLNAGDELLALDGWRVRRLEDAKAWLDTQRACPVWVSRDQRLLQLSLPPVSTSVPGGAGLTQLSVLASPAREALHRRKAWLGA